jgi:hypothetical protein
MRDRCQSLQIYSSHEMLWPLVVEVRSSSEITRAKPVCRTWPALHLQLPVEPLAPPSASEGLDAGSSHIVSPQNRPRSLRCPLRPRHGLVAVFPTTRQRHFSIDSGILTYPGCYVLPVPRRSFFSVPSYFTPGPSRRDCLWFLRFDKPPQNLCFGRC